jgi:hypothetical protein
MVGVDLDCFFADRSIGGKLLHLEVHPPAKYSGKNSSSVWWLLKAIERVL